MWISYSCPNCDRDSIHKGYRDNPEDFECTDCTHKIPVKDVLAVFDEEVRCLTMSNVTFEEALARLIKKEQNLDFEPVIKRIDFSAGGDYQIGDYTWDHENTNLTVEFREPAGTPGRKYTHYLDLESYSGGFGGFMQAIINAAREM